MNFIPLIGFIILFVLTVFQILLIAGAPFGDFVWGSQHKVLSKKLRIGSIFSIVL